MSCSRGDTSWAERLKTARSNAKVLQRGLREPASRARAGRYPSVSDMLQLHSIA